MAVFFWFLVKREFSTVNFTRATQPSLSGLVVIYTLPLLLYLLSPVNYVCYI